MLILHPACLHMNESVDILQRPLGLCFISCIHSYKILILGNRNVQLFLIPYFLDMSCDQKLLKCIHLGIYNAWVAYIMKRNSTTIWIK